jgi:hypothetical protein
MLGWYGADTPPAGMGETIPLPGRRVHATARYENTNRQAGPRSGQWSFFWLVVLVGAIIAVRSQQTEDVQPDNIVSLGVSAPGNGGVSPGPRDIVGACYGGTLKRLLWRNAHEKRKRTSKPTWEGWLPVDNRRPSQTKASG